MRQTDQRRPGTAGAAPGRRARRSAARGAIARPRRRRRWLATARRPALEEVERDEHDERRRRAARSTTAAAPVALSLSIWLKMCTEATWVLNGRLPEISTVEPNSLIARANDSAVPAAIAGSRFGRMIRRKMVNRLGAERGGGLLHLAVELEQHRLHGAHDERQRHEQQRDDDAGPGVGQVDADRALRAVERRAARGRRRSSAARTAGRSACRATRWPGKLVAHQHPGDERAHHHVDRRATMSDEHDGELERRPRLGRGDRVPRSAPSAVRRRAARRPRPAGSARGCSGRVVEPRPSPTACARSACRRRRRASRRRPAGRRRGADRRRRSGSALLVVSWCGYLLDRDADACARCRS